MPNSFRQETRTEFQQLLDYWKEVEFWLKKAEQINHQAVIPAINELRYAARQLYYAILLYRKTKLSDGEKSSIRKRIIIADQYLMNADHDIVDSIVGFVSEAIQVAEREIGLTDLVVNFPDYTAFKTLVDRVNDEILASRSDATQRKVIYRKIRNESLPEIITGFQSFTGAEVQARYAKEQLERTLKIKSRSNTILIWFSVLSGLASLVSVPLAFYLWAHSADALCSHDSPNENGAICYFVNTGIDDDQPDTTD